jgi:hypothetical protein
MTIKELKKYGFENVGHDVYHIPNIGNFKIPESYKINDILQLIYYEGFRSSRNQLQSEIKSILNIKNNPYG